MTFRHLSVLLLLGMLLPAQTPAVAPALAPFPGVRIGTWNLEFLGAPGNLRNEVPPRTDDDLTAIGAKVRSLGVAVLAVQEVCGDEPLRRVAAGAGPSWQHLLGTTGGWDDGKTAQNIGYLYDTAVVELLAAEELLSFPRELEGLPVFHRVPVTACFRVRATGFDFRLVTVHLKAGRTDKDLSKRRLEATTLRAWLGTLQQTAGEDQDIAVLGDFNSSYQAEPETILEQGGALQYLAPATATPTIMHFAEPIDHIVVGAGFAELQSNSLVVHSDYGGLDKNAWRKVYSDHFPVTADFVASADHDPAATFGRGSADHVLPVSLRVATMAVARSRVWPPTVGTPVRVTTAQHAVFEGPLLAPLPDGPGGWVVVEAQGRVNAVPLSQVTIVTLQ